MCQTTCFIIATIVIILLAYLTFGNTISCFSSSNKTIIWFYRPGCGHCTNMSPEWDKFTILAKNLDIQLQKVNTVENPKMAAEFKVNGVPYIVKVVNGVQTAVYQGNRTAPDLLLFASS
jgi:thioredoxin-like negative regulator of GroEL